MKILPLILGMMFLSAAGAQAQQPKRSQQPRATLEQQKMCADQAKKAFNERREDLGFQFFSSHYDPTANICYVLHTKQSSGSFLVISVYDAFEGRSYGEFYRLDKENFDNPTCYVKPRKDKIGCKTEDEFRKLVEKHFGVAD